MNRAFQKFAENSTLEFNISEFGFWYAYKTKNEIDGIIQKKEIMLLFHIKLKILTITYFIVKRSGKVSFVDEEDLIPAIKENPSEKVKLLFLFCILVVKSNSIGTNQPLKFTIKLIKLKQKKYESQTIKIYFYY